MSVTKILRTTAITLFVIAVPLFLITSNVRWVISTPWLYSYGFDKYDIPAYTGIERGELLSAASQLRDYFSNDEEFLRIRIFMRGILVDSLYNSREVLHMKDVKGLVKGVYRLQELTGLYLLAFVGVGLYLRRRQFLPSLARYVGMGGGATLGIAALAGMGALIGFERLFLLFHLLSFSNDLWQLDPRTDYLIAMFPEGFFFDATIWIAGSTILQALLLAVVPFTLLRWWPRRRVSRAERRLAARAQAR